MNSLGAIVLAGGRARRLGGVVKPAIQVGGVRMLDRVIAALAAADPIVVVGPKTLSVPAGVTKTGEDPPGGGPVAAIGAAIDTGLFARVTHIAIVAGDLPLVTSSDIARLAEAVADPETGGVDGSLYVDVTGRPQWLCGVWRASSIQRRIREFGELANGSLRALLGPMSFGEVRAGEEGLPPFFDCDTDDDIRRAEEWLRR